MPSRNVIKIYVDHTYYHIYNRGVEKRQIFLDKQDYTAFLGCLKLYLTPPQSIDRRFAHTLQGETLSDTKIIYAPSRKPNNHEKLSSSSPIASCPITSIFSFVLSNATLCLVSCARLLHDIPCILTKNTNA